MDPEKVEIANDKQNSTEGKISDEVSDNYSNADLYIEPQTHSYKHFGIQWPYSPIHANSENYVSSSTVKSEYPCSSYSNTISKPTEFYQYNNVPYHDYSYTNQYTDWQHLHQWYYNYSSYTSERSHKYSDITNIVNMNSAQTEPTSAHMYVPQAGSDIARCSTPDLITALASLPSDSTTKTSRCISPLLSEANQVLSNNSPKTETCPNVSVVSEHGTQTMYMHVANRIQDSGYNSDLCMSPVYPFESKFTNSPNSDVKNESFSSDDDNKENLCDSVENSDSLSQFFSTYDTIKMCMPKPNLADFLKDPVKTQNVSMTADQVQSTDVTSSSLSSPYPVKLHARPIICHKMPPVHPHKPNIKKCESASKRKITDEEIQAVMQRENKRQRHNQPLNLKAVRIMTEWYDAHQENPYPSKNEKEKMAEMGEISVTQVKSWFANKRNRSNNTKPKVQKRQMTERLLNICHQLARSSKQPSVNNADIIQQLSTIITTPQPTQEEM